MKDIPNRLECAYCIRNYTHGGECQKPKYSDTGCLAFKADPKGCIRRGDLRFEVPIYFNFPPRGVWDKSWAMNGVDTDIRINRIESIGWNKKKGTVIVYCDCEYYVNEYHENYKAQKKKPVFKLV